MKLALALTCLFCLTLTGTLFAFSRSASADAYAAFAGAAGNVSSCEMATCGCMGMRCSCAECGGGK